MSKYRVSEGAPGVSLNKRVYLPGEELPETLTEEAAEQLLKSGAVEKVSEDTEKAEKPSAHEGTKDEKSPATTGAPTGQKSTTQKPPAK